MIRDRLMFPVIGTFDPYRGDCIWYMGHKFENGHTGLNSGLFDRLSLVIDHIDSLKGNMEKNDD